MFKPVIMSIIIVTSGMFSLSSSTLASSVSSISSEKVCSTVTIDKKGLHTRVFYMSSNKKGTYWLAPHTKGKDVLFVPNSVLKSSHINKSTLYMGDKYEGILDKKATKITSFVF